MTLLELQDVLGKAIVSIEDGTGSIDKAKAIASLAKQMINNIGTVIRGRNHGARVKTENGYVAANAYFRKKYGRSKDEMIIHLNGDLADFSENNIEFVSKAIYSSLCWRKWLFTNPELTKTAILTAKLLEYFPDLRHNENQFYGNRSDST